MNVHVRRARGDDGFTIVESMIALAMLFVVMVGMLATLTGGLRGVVTGRQREQGLAIASAALEAARATAFDRVGHDLDGDATLGTDANVVVEDGHGHFEDEDLVGVAGAGEPFAPHEAAQAAEGTTYTRRLYVTWADPSAGGQGVKRVTVVVSWDQAQFGASGTLPEVRLSSLLTPAGVVAPTRHTASSNVEGPSLTVTGEMSEIDFTGAHWWGPIATADLESAFVRSVTGRGETSRVRIDAEDTTGCTTADDDTWSSCGGLRAASGADDDGATAAAESGTSGTLVGAGGTARANPALRWTLNSGSTTVASSTARSSSIGDGDGLPYQESSVHGVGSARLIVNFDSEGVGRVFSGGAAPESTATVDMDPAGDERWASATGRAVLPAFDLMTLDDPSATFSGYQGALRFSAATLTATASAGVGAPSPALTGGPVTVQLYSTSIAGHYVCYRISPTTGAVTTCLGTATTLAPQHAVVTDADGVTYVIDSSLSVAPATIASTGSGATVSSASTQLRSWLTADLHVQMLVGGDVEAELDLHLDAGTLLASAGYEVTS